MTISKFSLICEQVWRGFLSPNRGAQHRFGRLLCVWWVVLVVCLLTLTHCTNPPWRFKSRVDRGNVVGPGSKIVPDPNSLYVSRIPVPDDVYGYMRFWPNGRIVVRSVLIRGGMPSAFDGNCLSSKLVSKGYYVVSGPIIDFEIQEDGGKYWGRGIIDEEGFSMEQLPGGIFGRDRRYERYERLRFSHGELNTMPDW